MNFQHNQVFDSATNYVAIIVLSKVKRENVTVVLINKTAPDILEHIKQSKITGTGDTDFRIFSIKFNDFQSSSWVLEDPQTIRIIKKLQKNEPLGKYACFVTGLRTGKDSLYIVEMLRKRNFYFESSSY